MSSGTKADKKPAAVADPASRPPVLFKSALCVGEIASEFWFWLISSELVFEEALNNVDKGTCGTARHALD